MDELMEYNINRKMPVRGSEESPVSDVVEKHPVHGMCKSSEQRPGKEPPLPDMDLMPEQRQREEAADARFGRVVKLRCRGAT